MNCAICHNSNTGKTKLDFGGSITTDGKFIDKNITLTYCCNCGYISVNNSTADSASYYKNEYDFLTDDTSAEAMIFRKGENISISRYLIDIIGEFIVNQNNKKWLDVGAGKGLFLDNIHKDFPDIKYSAIEPGQSYKTLLKRQFIEKSYNSFLEDLDFTGKRFDYISLWFVIEHVENPLAFLNLIRSIVDHDSYLFLSLPNFEMDKSDILTIDHISKFTEKSFLNICKIAGFEILKKINESVSMYYVLKPAKVKTDISPVNTEEYINDAKLYIERIISHSKNLSNERLAIYGRGKLLPFLLSGTGLSPDAIACIIDDNPLLKNERYNNIEVVNFEEFKSRYNTKIIILNMNEIHHKKVIGKLDGYEIYA